MSERRIVKRKLEERKRGKTDWMKLQTQGDAEIHPAAGDDADAPLWTEEEMRSARLSLPNASPKIPISIRLDREVVEYFKRQGDGYQSRMSAVLLSYVRTHREPRAPRSTTRKRGGRKDAS